MVGEYTIIWLEYVHPQISKGLKFNSTKSKFNFDVIQHISLHFARFLGSSSNIVRSDMNKKTPVG